MEIKIFTILLSSLCLVSCVPSKSESATIKTPSGINSEVIHDYIEVNEYRLSWNKIFDIDLENYFVYFYQKTCSHCQNLKNWIIDEAIKRKDIYFVEDSSETRFTSDISKTIGLESIENFAILGFPSMVKISEGKVIKNVAGEREIKSLINI